MKKVSLFVFLAILAMCSIASASPSLTCDPVAGATYYTVKGLPADIDASHIPAIPEGTEGFLLDLANLPPGDYAVTAQACDDLWGCSADSSPFDFTRPMTGGVVNIRLVR